MAHFGIEDERSQDGSTASNPRPLTKLSKLMIVFNFIEHSPGIGLLSHVVKPVLPQYNFYHNRRRCSCYREIVH